MRYYIIEWASRQYRITEDGVVERLLADGSWTPMRMYIKNGSLTVDLRVAPRKQKAVAVNSLMRDYFMGGARPGYKLAHKNLSVYDCSLPNLVWVTQKQLCKMYDTTNRKPVAKINRLGEILEVYGSISEAARKNFISVSAIINRCKGKIQCPFKLTNYSFQYEV